VNTGVQALTNFNLWVVKTRKKRQAPSSLSQALVEAADRHRKLELNYTRKDGSTDNYIVAPYSYREKGGHTYLFAYDFGARSIKAFNVSGINGAEVLDESFRPRWDVELALQAMISDLYKQVGGPCQAAKKVKPAGEAPMAGKAKHPKHLKMRGVAEDTKCPFKEDSHAVRSK